MDIYNLPTHCSPEPSGEGVTLQRVQTPFLLLSYGGIGIGMTRSVLFAEKRNAMEGGERGEWYDWERE